jgi:hypothetical protein
VAKTGTLMKLLTILNELEEKKYIYMLTLLPRCPKEIMEIFLTEDKLPFHSDVFKVKHYKKI